MATTYRIRTTKRTDIRVRMMNEIINGIQIIKFYAWERNFAKVVDAIRQKELRAVKGTSYILASIHSLWVVAKISLFLTLITYVYSGNVLTARKVFIVSAYFSILQESMVKETNFDDFKIQNYFRLSNFFSIFFLYFRFIFGL